MGIEKQLKKETEKWLSRIDKERKKITDGNDYIIKNLDAYVSDSRHFLAGKDFIRAFEAVIWAWAFLEIGIQAELIRTKARSRKG